MRTRWRYLLKSRSTVLYRILGGSRIQSGDSESDRLKSKNSKSELKTNSKNQSESKIRNIKRPRNVEKVGDQILVSYLVRVHFDQVLQNYRHPLSLLLLALPRRFQSQGSVTISGHTDNIPIAFSERFDSNWDLSAARAAAVADFMIQSDIPDDRMTVLGFADTQPVASNDTPEGRVQNRRIEILIDS